MSVLAMRGRERGAAIVYLYLCVMTKVRSSGLYDSIRIERFLTVVMRCVAQQFVLAAALL